MTVLVQKMLLRDEPQADRGARTLRSATEASAEHEQELVGAFKSACRRNNAPRRQPVAGHQYLRYPIRKMLGGIVTVATAEKILKLVFPCTCWWIH